MVSKVSVLTPESLFSMINKINHYSYQVEINLGRDFQFHSVFACPILRQQCGRSNPPMRLVCGHVISKDAMQRLSHGNK